MSNRKLKTVLLAGIALGCPVSAVAAAALLPSAASQAAISQLIPIGSLLVFDDFNRGDTSPGTLGIPSTGGPWDLRGAYVSSFPLPAATSGQIHNGAFVDGAPYTVYAAQNLSSTVRSIGGRLSWSPSTGAVNSTTFAMLISANNNLITDMVHFVVNRSGWELQVRGSSPGAGSTGGAFVTIASQAFHPIWPANGTPLNVGVSISGQTVTVDANDSITTASDPRIPNLIGPYAVWEHYYPVQGSANIDALSIDDVWAASSPAASSELNAPGTARLLPRAAGFLPGMYASLTWQYLSELDVGKEGRIRNRTSSSAGSGNAGAVGGFLTGQVIDGGIKAPGAANAKAHGYLLAAGLDYPLSNYFRLGISFAYGSVKAVVTQTNDRIDTRANQVLFYGRLGQRAFIDGFVGASVQSMNTERFADIGSERFVMNGHMSDFSPVAGLQLGELFNIAGTRFQPALGVQYAHPSIDGYTETGGLPAMQFNAFDSNELDARAGFDANWSFRVDKFVVKPDAHAFFVANVIDSNNSLTGAFAAIPDVPLTFADAKASPEWLEFGLGADVELWKGALLGARYSGTSGRGDLSYRTWTAELKYSF